ncbi:alcohol dehydrogenase catalytic domain-containing protein [Herbidospora sp. NBRC 101105]|uniref:alcohol dehydrogenase catalytic domain-containing protein n=1 Tax=Herbidospora sp. NBRC 101105 TaxID=3032195 RepID=UPI0024A015CE|nr:alcohol dehydrogenase catalytic domain-containing protein [Herbidospora sp. NBRC 101105]GLX99606.1 alcohol dehydrogenase [Herbidospora sp. NBRC 101105]
MTAVPADAIIRIDAVTICGTDLHILRGDVPEVAPGRILGHEAVGTVVATGPAVAAWRPGDRVLVSCISACGCCRYCRSGVFGQCLGGGGWILGHLIDGTQAEYVRVPFADTSLYPVPENVPDRAALMLADILPTAYEVGVRNGAVRPGDTVVIVGAGPIGLASVTTARLFTPNHIVAVDPAALRRDAAKMMGADVTADTAEEAGTAVAELTGGLGADVAIEAVGVSATFELCARLVRPGGRVANVGVHGGPATLRLERLWSRNVTITTGLVDTSSTPDLMRMVAAGRMDTSAFVTHDFPLSEMEAAYRTFTDAATTGALKIAAFRDALAA